MFLVAGFLEMFAGVQYNREKNQSLIYTPSVKFIKRRICSNVEHLPFLKSGIYESFDTFIYDSFCEM